MESSEEDRTRVEVGPDPIERAERDMGLKIDPKTGRAFPSQGTFKNLDLGLSGEFYDGEAVPRARRCDSCTKAVTEPAFGIGFDGCGSFSFGPAGSFFLCNPCVVRALRAFPRIRELIEIRLNRKLRV